MTRLVHLLAATALLALAGCNGPATDENASNESAGFAPQDCTATEGVSKGPFCGFKAHRESRQPMITVSGQYRLASRTGTVSLRKGLDGINPTIMMVDVVIDNTTGSGGHWVPVSGQFDANKYESVTVRDDKGQEINVPVDPASKAAADGEKVSFRGCPIKSGLGAGCITVKAENGTTYELYSSGPLPDPAQQLVVEGTGTSGGVSNCMVGTPLNEVEWQYTKAKCPDAKAD